MYFSPQKITTFCQKSNFRPIDFLLATFLANKEEQEKKNIIFCITLLTSFRLSQGYIFLSEEKLEENLRLIKELLKIQINIIDLENQNFTSLAKYPTEKPLVLDNKKIYFQKFFQYQRQIFDFFKKNDNFISKPEFFLKKQEKLDKMQATACNALLHYPVSIISGGPGTGKTFLIGKFIETLQKNKKKNIKIALVSFTGKAVQRIKEQLPTRKIQPIFANCYLIDNIFLSVSTIHYLLVSKKSYYYNKNKEQFLWDWVIIDEASMVGLALICQLLKKLPHHTKLAFIGDSEQLTPLDAGYFFFDICKALKPNLPFYFHLLKNNHRSGNQVLQLVKNIFETIPPVLEQKEIIFFQQKQDFYKNIKIKSQKHWLALCNATNPKDAFKIYYQFVILCALNISDFGVIAIQNWIVNELERNGEKKKKELFYNGRPILIQNNTPSLGVYNGDIGICLKEKDSYKVHFKKRECFLAYDCNELPEHQSAYAISVHKSQGSEFKEVLICLPNKHLEILHRELLYTAITRAKLTASILTTKEVLQQTIKSKHQETTNLKELFLRLETEKK